MAVVIEMKASNGAAVRIHDDAYDGVPCEEMRRRQQAVIECARRITVNAEIRRIRRERETDRNRNGMDVKTNG